jgi:hypothetical protein
VFGGRRGELGDNVRAEPGWKKDLQLGEGAVEEPRYDGEVAALIVGWKEDGVFIF